MILKIYFSNLCSYLTWKINFSKLIRIYTYSYYPYKRYKVFQNFCNLLKHVSTVRCNHKFLFFLNLMFIAPSKINPGRRKNCKNCTYHLNSAHKTFLHRDKYFPYFLDCSLFLMLLERWSSPY